LFGYISIFYSTHKKEEIIMSSKNMSNREEVLQTRKENLPLTGYKPKG